MKMNDITTWQAYLDEKRYQYLFISENFAGGRVLRVKFEKGLDPNDRKISNQKAKQLLTKQGYDKFLNSYRVFKSRHKTDMTSLSISNQAKTLLVEIKNEYGFESLDETIETIATDFKEKN